MDKPTIPPPTTSTGQTDAARVILFHQSVAERLGLTGTQFKCFRLVERLGPMSLTSLAHEAAGFIKRERDRAGRRRLVLVAVPEAADRAGALYGDQAEGMAGLLHEYAERDFELLLQFLERTADVLAGSQRALIGPDYSEPITV